MILRVYDENCNDDELIERDWQLKPKGLLLLSENLFHNYVFLWLKTFPIISKYTV